MSNPLPPSDDPDDLAARMARQSAMMDDDELAVEVDDVAVMALLKGLDDGADMPDAPDFMGDDGLDDAAPLSMAQMAALASAKAGDMPADLTAVPQAAIPRTERTPAPAMEDDFDAVEIDDMHPAYDDDAINRAVAEMEAPGDLEPPPPAPAPMMSGPTMGLSAMNLFDEPEPEPPPPSLADMLDEDGNPRMRRFLFEHDFDEDNRPPEPEPEPIPEPITETVPPWPAEPPSPMYSAEELHAARMAAYADGETHGLQTAMASLEQKISRAMEQVGAQLPGLQDDRAQIVQAVSGEAARLAHAMLDRLFPEIARRYGFAEIEAVIASSLEQAIDQPRIIIRLHPDITDAIGPKAEHMSMMAGYAGRLSILPDAALGPSDVRIEWGDGGAERLIARAWGDISDIVGRAVTHLAETVPSDHKADLSAA